MYVGPLLGITQPMSSPSLCGGVSLQLCDQCYCREPAAFRETSDPPVSQQAGPHALPWLGKELVPVSRQWLEHRIQTQLQGLS